MTRKLKMGYIEGFNYDIVKEILYDLPEIEDEAGIEITELSFMDTEDSEFRSVLYLEDLDFWMKQREVGLQDSLFWLLQSVRLLQYSFKKKKRDQKYISLKIQEIDIKLKRLLGKMDKIREHDDLKGGL